MIVTGALLADAAFVANNKLNIAGGVVDTFQANDQRLVNVTLVVLIKPEPFDQSPKIDVTFTDPSGNTTEEHLGIPESSLGGEVGFVYYPMTMPVPVKGRYQLKVSSHTGTVLLPMKVTN